MIHIEATNRSVCPSPFIIWSWDYHLVPGILVRDGRIDLKTLQLQVWLGGRRCFQISSPRSVVLVLCSVHVVLQMEISAYACSHLSDNVATVHRFVQRLKYFLPTPVLHSFKGDPFCQCASYIRTKNREPFSNKKCSQPS